MGLLRGLRHRVHARAWRIRLRLTEALGPDHSIPLEYPTSYSNEPRYGHGRPPHPLLAQLIEGSESNFRSALEEMAAYRAGLEAIPLRQRDPGEPHWGNLWLPGMDAAVIYAYVRSHSPDCYLEVGSGSSTLFAQRARRDGRGSTRIVSIDPKPREGVDPVCDEVIRAPLESVDLSIFSELVAGDLVFVDGTHRTFMNSDATVFFLDVLPRLPSGVMVAIHDVFLPNDYPPQWRRRYYSEQYLLATHLLGARTVRLRLASYHVSRQSRLMGILGPLPELWGRASPPTSFWFYSEPGEMSA
jgi:Methyltransferase domain